MSILNNFFNLLQRNFFINIKACRIINKFREIMTHIIQKILIIWSVNLYVFSQANFCKFEYLSVSQHLIAVLVSYFDEQVDLLRHGFSFNRQHQQEELIPIHEATVVEINSVEDPSGQLFALHKDLIETHFVHVVINSTHTILISWVPLGSSLMEGFIDSINFMQIGSIKI